MPKTCPLATPSATLRASPPAAHGVILLTRQPTTATSLKKKDTVSFNKMSSGTTTSSFAPDDGVRVPNTSAELQLTQLELLLQQLPLLPRIELLTQQLQRATMLDCARPQYRIRWLWMDRLRQKVMSL